MKMKKNPGIFMLANKTVEEDDDDANDATWRGQNFFRSYSISWLFSEPDLFLWYRKKHCFNLNTHECMTLKSNRKRVLHRLAKLSNCINEVASAAASPRQFQQCNKWYKIRFEGITTSYTCSASKLFLSRFLRVFFRSTPSWSICFVIVTFRGIKDRRKIWLNLN